MSQLRVISVVTQSSDMPKIDTDSKSDLPYIYGKHNLLLTIFNYLPGIIALRLNRYFGCKLMTIIGSLISAFGFFLSSFAPNVFVLYISFSLIAGNVLYWIIIVLYSISNV